MQNIDPPLLILAKKKKNLNKYGIGMFSSGDFYLEDTFPLNSYNFFQLTDRQKFIVYFCYYKTDVMICESECTLCNINGIKGFYLNSYLLFSSKALEVEK